MKFLTQGSEETFYATIHMAGDYVTASHVIRKFVMRGACVQLTPVDFIYTGGKETGFTARMIQYPRFVKKEEEIYQMAVELANELANELSQISFTIETNKFTTYFQGEGVNKR